LRRCAANSTATGEASRSGGAASPATPTMARLPQVRPRLGISSSRFVFGSNPGPPQHRRRATPRRHPSPATPWHHQPVKPTLRHFAEALAAGRLPVFARGDVCRHRLRFELLIRADEIPLGDKVELSSGRPEEHASTFLEPPFGERRVDAVPPRFGQRLLFLPNRSRRFRRSPKTSVRIPAFLDRRCLLLRSTSQLERVREPEPSDAETGSDDDASPVSEIHVQFS
jgi:hypothetical protein